MSNPGQSPYPLTLNFNVCKDPFSNKARLAGLGGWDKAVSLVATIQPTASLGAQMVKNLPAILETLGWEDPQRRASLPTPVFLPGEFHGQRSLVDYSPWGLKSQT